MGIPNNSFKWLKVFFFWSLLTAVGWTIGMIVIEDVNLLIGMLALGVALGLGQSLVLYSKFLGVGWEKGFGLWILATILGTIIGFIILALFNSIGLGSISIVMWGAALGLAQWLVLRKKVKLSGFWILATVIGWLATNVSNWPFWQGLVFGLVTGIVLVFLSAKSQAQSID